MPIRLESFSYMGSTPILTVIESGLCPVWSHKSNIDFYLSYVDISEKLRVALMEGQRKHASYYL